MKFLILILLASLSACANKTARDFNLILETETDRIDVRGATLERKYINGTHTYKLNFTEKSIKAIFELVSSKGIQSIEPKDLVKPCRELMTPEFTHALTIQHDSNKTVRLEWTSNQCGKHVADLNMVVERLYDLIRKDNGDKILSTDIEFE
jgi:hypothetical protein